MLQKTILILVRNDRKNASLVVLFFADDGHTAMRAPSGYVTRAKAAGNPVKILRDVWEDDEFQPDFDEEFHPGLFSTDSNERDVYKSPLVECAWDKVEQVRDTLAS